MFQFDLWLGVEITPADTVHAVGLGRGQAREPRRKRADIFTQPGAGPREIKRRGRASRYRDIGSRQVGIGTDDDPDNTGCIRGD